MLYNCTSAKLRAATLLKGQALNDCGQASAVSRPNIADWSKCQMNKECCVNIFDPARKAASKLPSSTPAFLS